MPDLERISVPTHRGRIKLGEIRCHQHWADFTLTLALILTTMDAKQLHELITLAFESGLGYGLADVKAGIERMRRTPSSGASQPWTRNKTDCSVGAALLTDIGPVGGCNVENASYGEPGVGLRAHIRRWDLCRADSRSGCCGKYDKPGISDPALQVTTCLTRPHHDLPPNTNTDARQKA